MFAALNTMEPPIFERTIALVVESREPRAAQRMPLLESRIRTRLSALDTRLDDAEWLDGGFSAGDLLMVNVLPGPKTSGLLDEYPRLAAYVARGEARPACRRAFDAQPAAFERSRPWRDSIRHRA